MKSQGYRHHGSEILRRIDANGNETSPGELTDNGGIRGEAVHNCSESVDPENENPGTLAGVTGADEMPHTGQGGDSWKHIRDAIPVRHIKAFAALYQAWINLRHGADHTESLARVLATKLGPRELIQLADAADMACVMKADRRAAISPDGAWSRVPGKPNVWRALWPK